MDEDVRVAKKRKLEDQAARIKERKELLKKPVPMMPDDPENIRISKAQFIEKRRKQKEKAAAIKRFAEEYDNKQQQPGPGPDEPKKVEPEETSDVPAEEKKKGRRPRKIEE